MSFMIQAPGIGLKICNSIPNLSLDIYANTKQYHLLGGIVVVLGDPVKEGVSGGPEELVSAASRGVDVIKLFTSVIYRFP